MESIKLVDYKEVIHKVYDLSIIYQAYVHQESEQLADRDDLFESLKEYQARRRESELYQYLHELDTETVKVIEAVMYIGRDFPFTREERTQLEIEQDDIYEAIDSDPPQALENRIRENPDAVLIEEMEQLDQGEREKKSIIINRILEKAQRSNYLKRGINLLGI